MTKVMFSFFKLLTQIQLKSFKALTIRKLKETIYQLDLQDDLLSKKVHLVCISVNTLTTFNAYATAILKMTFEDAVSYSEIVNKKNEVGNFYPKHNLTIVPLSIYQDRNDFGNREILKKHILDCFASNEKYIKCQKLIFGMEFRDDFDNNLFEEIFFELVNDYVFHQTEEISICSY